MVTYSLQLQRLSFEALKGVQGAASTLQQAGFEDVNLPSLLQVLVSRLARKRDPDLEETRKPADRKATGSSASLEKSQPLPPRPDGMMQPSEATDGMRARQKREPQKWWMTLGQWLDVLTHCINTEQYQELKATKKMVNMYDIDGLCVKPWTATSGCGLAIMMNPQADADLDAELMFSHAWGEDVEESKIAVESAMQQNPALHRDVRIWFCVFANYQCQDGYGPTIDYQLSLNPFAEVISTKAVKSGHGMCAIHTTKADLYSRLWCVHEVAEAESKELNVFSAMSPEYIEKIARRMGAFVQHGYDKDACLLGAGISCKTITAECGYVSDEVRLLEEIGQKPGGFVALDEKVLDFRLRTLPPEVRELELLANLNHESFTDEQRVDAIKQAANIHCTTVTGIDILEKKLLSGGPWSNHDVIKEAIKAIMHDDHQVASRALLLRLLKHKDSIPYVQICVHEALGAIGRKGDEEFLAALRAAVLGAGQSSENAEDVWCSAVKALAALAPESEADSIVADLLSSLDPKYWRELPSMEQTYAALALALDTLGCKRNASVLPFLELRIMEDRYPRRSPARAAAKALKEISAPSDLKEVIQRMLARLHEIVADDDAGSNLGHALKARDLVDVIKEDLIPWRGGKPMGDDHELRDLHRAALLGLLECLRIGSKQALAAKIWWDGSVFRPNVEFISAVQLLGVQPGHEEAVELLLPLAAPSSETPLGQQVSEIAYKILLDCMHKNNEEIRPLWPAHISERMRTFITEEQTFQTDSQQALCRQRWRDWYKRHPVEISWDVMEDLQLLLEPQIAAQATSAFKSSPLP